MDSLYRLVKKWSRERPDAIALKGAGSEITWFQLDDAVDNMSQCLREQGISRDDVIAAVSKNSRRSLSASLAAAAICWR